MLELSIIAIVTIIILFVFRSFIAQETNIASMHQDMRHDKLQSKKQHVTVELGKANYKLATKAKDAKMLSNRDCKTVIKTLSKSSLDEFLPKSE